MKELLTHQETLLSIFAAAPVLALPFSKQIRNLIFKRDNGECQYGDCDRSFEDGWVMNAMHFIHDKSSDLYDNPIMGEIRCIPHHVAYHLLHKGNAAKIGLSEMGNSGAIKLIKDSPQRTREFWENFKK